MTTTVAITKAQAKALTDALSPIVHLILNPADLEDRKRFAELVAAGVCRLHISAIVSAGPLEVVVAEVDPAGVREPVILGSTLLDGGALMLTPDGASFN